MRIAGAGVCVVVVWTVVGAPPVRAAEMTAEDIVERYAEAVGGLDAVHDLTGLKKTGLYVYNGLEHPIVVFQDDEGRYREEIDGFRAWAGEVRPGEIFVRATDGEVAWMDGGNDEVDGPQALSETATIAFIEDAWIATPLIAAASGWEAVELIGEEDIDGAATYRLRVQSTEGRAQHWYVRKSDFLPVTGCTRTTG